MYKRVRKHPVFVKREEDMDIIKFVETSHNDIDCNLYLEVQKQC
jgi:hypothetical protein